MILIMLGHIEQLEYHGRVKMEEKVSIEFTGKEFDLIMQYMKAVEATTVQNAILNAISVALDRCDD